MKAYREALALIKENRFTFIILNIAYFATVVLGMVLIRSKPEIQQELLSTVANSFSSGPLQFIAGAYSNGQVINAVVFTYFTNIFLGCFVAINLPSMIIPFSGFLVGGVRAILWGFLFSPEMMDLTLAKVLIAIGIGLLILLEGEGYVLALLAAYLHGKAWLIPSSVGADSLHAGYLSGIRITLRLYLLILSILLVAAIYEVALSILPALLS
jgi:hypothetical protein